MRMAMSMRTMNVRRVLVVAVVIVVILASSLTTLNPSLVAFSAIHRNNNNNNNVAVVEKSNDDRKRKTAAQYIAQCSATTTTTTSTSTSTTSIDYPAIAAARNLRHSRAADLLRRIHVHDGRRRRDAPYRAERDLLVFEHVLKTGGTSLSDKLLQIVGKKAVVPGSKPSGFFQKNELVEALQEIVEKNNNNNNANSTKDEAALVDWWKSKRVMYSHTPLSRYNSTDFEDWFLARIPDAAHKRVYLMTLYRDPIEWLASNFNEWMCKLRARIVAAYAGLYPGRPHPTRTPITDAHCWGMTNLTVLADYYVQHTLPEQCAAAGANANKRYCRQLEQHPGMDPTRHCRSARDFMASAHFAKMRLNPDYLVKQPKDDGKGQADEDDDDDDEYYESSDAASQSTTIIDNTIHVDDKILQAELANVEERTLQLYGGLAPQSRVPFAWIGLTERYDEGLVLLYDWLGLPIDKSLGTEKKQRYKTCRPTSFWSDEEQALMSRLVVHSWTVHRAANAIIDLRMADWCCRRQQQQPQFGQADHDGSEDPIYQRFCTSNNGQEDETSLAA